MVQPNPGAQRVTPLTGNELVDILGLEWGTATTAQIAGLASLGTTEIVNTPITTVGNGTLTAAGMVGGLITRTGPVAAYSDATDTAVAIVAALPSFVAGSTFFISFKNATAFTQTITAGAGVTLPTTNIVAGFEIGNYYGTVGGTAGSPTVVLTHLGTTAIGSAQFLVSPSATALVTVGAGTVTAAAINGGAVTRAGAQSSTPFTDTTDVATAIIAGNPGLIGKIGAGIRFEYVNLTNAVATVTGGTGVTVSQPGATLTTTAIVPSNTVAVFAVSYTAAATLTFVCLAVTTINSATTTFSGSTSGQTTLQSTAVAAGTLTLPPVTGTVASTTGANLFLPDLKKTSASVTVNGSAAYVNVTGLSFTVVPGTYQFDCYLPSTVANGTGGIKYAFNYTTTVLSSIQATGVGSTSAAAAVQQTQTTTTQTDIFTQAAVVINTVIKGTMVVTTGGTVDIQVSQNTSNGSNTIALIGGYAVFTRIA